LLEVDPLGNPLELDGVNCVTAPVCISSVSPPMSLSFVRSLVGFCPKKNTSGLDAVDDMDGVDGMDGVDAGAMLNVNAGILVA
jgi:hypothetical protein